MNVPITIKAAKTAVAKGVSVYKIKVTNELGYLLDDAPVIKPVATWQELEAELEWVAQYIKDKVAAEKQRTIAAAAQKQQYHDLLSVAEYCTTASPGSVVGMLWSIPGVQMAMRAELCRLRPADLTDAAVIRHEALVAEQPKRSC